MSIYIYNNNNKNFIIFKNNKIYSNTNAYGNPNFG